MLRSGDRITGEVTELDRGRLTFKTDDMGTLSIEWDKVTSVTAKATFEVHDLDGGQYFGALRPGAQDGELTVVPATGAETKIGAGRTCRRKRESTTASAVNATSGGNAARRTVILSIKSTLAAMPFMLVPPM